MDKSDQLTMKKQNKLIQIIQNFFIKSAQIILQSRTLSESEEASRISNDKLNKWFNLYIHNNNPYDIKVWKSQIDKNQNNDNGIIIPPMIIETYLDLRQLTPNQIVVLQDEHQNSWQVAKQKKLEIVLERWLIEFDPNDISEFIDDELPLIYKQSIILFRALYTLARVLPSFKLKKLLLNENSNLIIKNNLIEGTQQISSKGRIGLSKSIIPHQMLTSENHITHKQFKPIHTTKGSLKVSIAYRNHYHFFIQDSEQVLSNQFANMDKPRRQSPNFDNSLPIEIIKDLHRRSIDQGMRKSIDEASHGKSIPKSNNDDDNYHHPNVKFSSSRSISPCTSGREISPNFIRPTPPTKLPIQPFKVGSISSSPPPTGTTPTSSSLERKISITSKSTSNASLAALLRNQRGSNSSGTSNIPITNTQSLYPSTVGGNIPRSISSSHGVDEGEGSTPKFSSSFGSRVSRRFSSASNRQSTPLANQSHTESLLGTSAGLATSTNAPLSGLYADDDISDFVKMIDSTVDLRLGQNHQYNTMHHHDSVDQLNKFQSLKNTHQQIGDNLNASIHQQHQPSPLSPHYHQHSGLSQQSYPKATSHPVSQSSFGYMGERSRRSITYSPPGSLQSDGNLPSINSRLDEKSSENAEGNNSRRSSFNQQSSSNKTANSTRSTPVPSASGSAKASNPREIKYENVFEDDYDEPNIEGSKSNAAKTSRKSEKTELQQTSHYHFMSNSPSGSRSTSHFQSHSSIQTPDDDDDDLLFTMSDMNITKN